jgi:hypothetical protein
MEIDVGDDYVELIHTCKLTESTRKVNGKTYFSYQCIIPRSFLDALIKDPTHTHLYEGKYFAEIRHYDTLELFHSSAIVDSPDFSFQIPYKTKSGYPVTLKKTFLNRFFWKYEELNNRPIDVNSIVVKLRLCFSINGGYIESQLFVHLEVIDDVNY